MGKLLDTIFIKCLKHIESRKTLYSNQYPYNCGYLWANGYLSFDCVNLVKSVINDPKVAYRKKPVGSWVMPGKVIPDLAGADIMRLCTEASEDFSRVPAGSFLLFEDWDHVGVFVGEYQDPSGTVNCIECTAAMGGGVKSSYCDASGGRWDHKGGAYLGRWVKHGLLTRWISYNKEKKKTVNQLAKEVIDGKWGNYPERKVRLEAAGYSYAKVQAVVNKLLAQG